MTLNTPRMDLVLETRESVLARVERMAPEWRKEISPVWLAKVVAGAEPAQWLHGFSMILRETGAEVGTGGFKGAPIEGTVEIAYGVEEAHQNKGLATEMARELTRFALSQPEVKMVIAHTRPENGASAKVLTKCGFVCRGEVMDPEDGLVWRWEKQS